MRYFTNANPFGINAAAATEWGERGNIKKIKNRIVYRNARQYGVRTRDWQLTCDNDNGTVSFSPMYTGVVL